MVNRNTAGRGLRRSLVLASMVAGSTFTVSTATFAGECPADKLKTDVRQPVSHAAKGKTDTVLAAIDLEKEPANIKGRQLRLRRLTIEPGGIVPWHSHGDRPAIIYVAEGEILEYASNCSVPILHKAGDVTTEKSGKSHWWENQSTKPVVLFSADLLRDKNDKHM